MPPEKNLTKTKPVLCYLRSFGSHGSGGSTCLLAAMANFPLRPTARWPFVFVPPKKLDFTECLIFVGVTRHRHPVSRFHPLFYPPPCFLQLD